MFQESGQVLAQNESQSGSIILAGDLISSVIQIINSNLDLERKGCQEFIGLKNGPRLIN